MSDLVQNIVQQARHTGTLNVRLSLLAENPIYPRRSCCNVSLLDISDVSLGILKDPKRYRTCGTYPYLLQERGDSVISITCQKCMPIGNHVTLQNGRHDRLMLNEIAVYGIEAHLIEG